MSDNYFKKLNEVSVAGKTEKKNNLTYLSWAYAWEEIKNAYPDTNYKVYENTEGYPMFTDGKTAMVKVGVTCNGIEHIVWLPIMDAKNRSMPMTQITSFDVNKSIMRALAKAVAFHGLGIALYTGEDLEDGESPSVIVPEVVTKPKLGSPYKSIQEAAVAVQTPIENDTITKEQIETIKALREKKGIDNEGITMGTGIMVTSKMKQALANKVIEWLKGEPDLPF